MRNKRYPILTFAAGAVCALPVLSQGIYIYLSAFSVFTVLCCIAYADLRTMMIPQGLLNLLLILCILNRATVAAAEKSYVKNLVEGLLGGLICFGFFFIVYHLSRKILGREGIGYGDVKLMAVSGILLGVTESIFAIAVASVSACVVILVLVVLTGKKRGRGYPFAPFLCFGVMLSYLFCQPLLDRYMQFLSTL